MNKKWIQAALIFTVLGLPLPARSADRKEAETKTLGYLQVKTRYAEAAWNEGKMEALKRVLEHRHSRTGKPYPCWNALRPFRGRDLPASIQVTSPENEKTSRFLSLAALPQDKLDATGGDARFDLHKPPHQEGFTVWRVDEKFARFPIHGITKPVVGLVDISGSMESKKKLKTLRSLIESDVRFLKLYAFSGRNTLKEIAAEDLKTVKPRGNTALYDELLRLAENRPGETILVLTDGRDNHSRIRFKAFLERIVKTGSAINIVLTGKNAEEAFNAVAGKTGGIMMRELSDSGEVFQSSLEIFPEP